MEQEQQPTPPTLQGQFNSLEAYQAINIAIIAYKDKQTNGEYSRTNTLYAYTPEPDPINGKYYMPATAEMQEAGLFDTVTLLEAIPEPERPNDRWLKADIQAWLTNNEPEIQWTTSQTKAQLLLLVP